jgi:3'(2'), 5'-bisphosphate nucleotidase
VYTVGVRPAKNRRARSVELSKAAGRGENKTNEAGLIRNPAVDDGLLDELTNIVSAAGAAVLAACTGDLAARAKADQSPVTAADHASEAVILEGLARVLPGIAVISEEASAVAPACADPPPERFVLVDPLDGTRELVAGRDEFTINLAIVTNGRPDLGIVAAPALGVLWRGVIGAGAERLRLLPGQRLTATAEPRPIHVRSAPPAGLIAAASRSHPDPQTEAFLARLPIAERRASGSAIKFCQVAEGAADVYPRLSTTCEWDVAAGHALVSAAGGLVAAPDGLPLRYGRRGANFRIPAFIAWGDPAAAARFTG